ncbi:hypothetical protein ATANTOWER_017260 [Ataeniobius toweri]|uniref:Uncharacterized protein n=1 Tax=Ataeniobius toweri TaxID=208326 RepID=A0ABU7C8X5_9TELE|nr:hypothetical protein [Ataeniobius toweri]
MVRSSVFLKRHKKEMLVHCHERSQLKEVLSCLLWRLYGHVLLAADMCRCQTHCGGTVLFAVGIPCDLQRRAGYYSSV